MQRIAISIWNTYDDSHWYATEKIEKVQSLLNEWSDFCYIYNMFDTNNQLIARSKMSNECFEEITKRVHIDEWTERQSLAHGATYSDSYDIE